MTAAKLRERHLARKLRIITGLILFLYTTGHLLNLAIGLNSVAVMDEWRLIFRLPWANTAGRTVLLAAIMTHVVLSLHTLYSRNTLKMSATDMVQFTAGLAIFPLLVPHIVGIRLTAELIANYQPSYRTLLHFFWIQNPFEGLRQILVLVFVWIHGAIGLLTYFRLQSWWSRFGKIINPLMVMVPVAALLGYVEAGKEVIATSPEYVPTPPGDEVLAVLNTISTTKWVIIPGYLIIVLLVVIARYIRLRNQAHTTEIHFVDGPVITAKIGANLLELAIANDVPQANLCRGRGRCGTCRVIISDAQNEPSPPGELEKTTLKKVGAGPDERLACQVKPMEGKLTVERLVPPHVQPEALNATFGTRREAGTVTEIKVTEASR